MEKPYCRKISPTEWLWLTYNKIRPPFAVQIAVEGIGTLNPDQVKKAVASASDACPGMRVILRRRKWIDTGIPPVVKVITETDFNGYNFEHADFLNNELNYKTGPTSEVILIKKENPTLFFRAVHAITDGIGLITYIKNVFKAMRNEAMDSAFSQITEKELVKKLPVKIKSDYGKLYTGPFDENCISKNIKTQIHTIKRYKIEKSSQFITAKLADAIIRTCDKDNLGFMIPVDARRHINYAPSTANLSMALFINATREDTWSSIQHKIIAKLKDNGELTLNGSERLLYTPQFLVRSFFRSVEQMQINKNMYYSSVTISNLMRLDLNDFSTESFKASSVYAIPQSAITPLMINIIEFDTHIEIIMRYENNQSIEETVEKIINNFKNLLEE